MKGESVLITGAGTGIGLATALRLAQEGCRVFASVPDLEQREEVECAARERGVDLSVIQLDVTDRDSIDAAVEAVREVAGGIDAVVNNAGLGLRGFFEDLSETEIRELFDVNLFGVMAVTSAVLPHMRAARKGRLVIMSSAGGRIAAMTLSAYCAAKFALEGFGESLAMELAPFGIRVSLIEPGLVMTPHFTVHRGRARKAVDRGSPYYDWFVQHESLVDGVLRARHITPDDVAAVVARCLSEVRPRLRYAVGWRARLLILLRRLLPAELFERLYFGQAIRMVTRPRKPARELSGALGAEPGTSVASASSHSRETTREARHA